MINGVLRIFIVANTEGRERKWGSWGGGSNPSPPAMGSGGALWALSQRSPGRPKVFHYFHHSWSQDHLSWHYNIVNCGLSCSHWGGGKTPVAPLRTPC